MVCFGASPAKVRRYDGLGRRLPGGLNADPEFEKTLCEFGIRRATCGDVRSPAAKRSINVLRNWFDQL